MNHLPGLASNHDPPDLCLLSSQDYRQQPLAPGCVWVLCEECPWIFLNVKKIIRNSKASVHDKVLMDHG
jgi:hypothetical protein